MKTDPIILFDGSCCLCNRSVDFILNVDRQKYLKFALQDSVIGKNILKEFNLHEARDNTIVLIDNGEAYVQSTAVLRITKHLGGMWPWLQIFVVVPVFIRDGIYCIIARNRYRWFGKASSCRLLEAEDRQRFL